MRFYIILQQIEENVNLFNSVKNIIKKSIKKDRFSGKSIDMYLIHRRLEMRNINRLIIAVESTELSYSRLQSRFEGFWPDPTLSKYCKKILSKSRVIVSFLKGNQLRDYYEEDPRYEYKYSVLTSYKELIFYLCEKELNSLVILKVRYFPYPTSKMSSYFNIEDTVSIKSAIGLFEFICDSGGIIYPKFYKHHNINKIDI